MNSEGTLGEVKPLLCVVNEDTGQQVAIMGPWPNKAMV